MPERLFDVSGTDDEPVLTLRVVVHPGAGRSAVVGQHGDALKVRVAAPPVEGRANRAVVELVADLLAVKEAQVSVASGESSRAKRLRIVGVAPEAAQRALDQAIHGAGQQPGRRAPGGRPPGPRRI